MMNKLFHLTFFALTACLTLAGFATSNISAAEWQAGVAKVNITPKKLMWMSGYGARDHAAEGKLTDLWAKALVIQDERGERAVLVTLDLVGIGRDVSQAVCAELQIKHKLERRQIAFNCSHTHCGPVIANNLTTMYFYDEAQQKLVEEYTTELKQNMVRVVGEAFANIAPAKFAWGNGRTTFAVNRRNNKEPDVPQLRAANMLQGPVDHDVAVLSVTGTDGKLKAVVFGYACHATTLSFYQWCGDWPGFAQSDLEAAHPGTVALFFAGCGADQNPLPRRTVELAQEYGRMAATAVDAVLAGKTSPISGTLVTRYEEIPLPFDTLPTRAQIEEDAKSTNKFIVGRAKQLLKQLDSGKPLGPTYPYPVQLWRLGSDLNWFHLGGEVVVDYSLRLKAEHGPAKTWVAGYANDVMAYIPSLRVLKEGGYEGGGAMVYYGLPTAWGPSVEEDIIKATHRLAN